MKKNIKCLSIMIMVILMITSVSVLVKAQTPKNVSLEGNADGIVFFPDNELFLSGTDMIPGDKVSGEINIKNNYEQSFKLYMKAERITNEEENDLLKALDLKITYKDKIIYQGNAAGDDGLNNNIYLGEFKSGDITSLVAEVYLDGKKIDNKYQNKYGEVKWIFTAETKEQPVNNNVPNNIVTRVFNGIKTGDKVIWSWLCICIGSFISTIILGKKIQLMVKEG